MYDISIKAMEVHRISPLSPPNQTFIRSKNVSDHVYDTFEHFCQADPYNGIGCLLLMSLDKVGKETDELRDSNSQTLNPSAV